MHFLDKFHNRGNFLLTDSVVKREIKNIYPQFIHNSTEYYTIRQVFVFFVEKKQ